MRVRIRLQSPFEARSLAFVSATPHAAQGAPVEAVPVRAGTMPPPRPAIRAGATDRALRNRRRVAAGIVFLATASVLGVAAWLTPDPSGVGTHLQLRMVPCGWTTGLGIPCPTCGMTTAFAAAAEGSLLASLKAQPLGFLLAVATSVAAVVSAFVVVTGSAVGGHLVHLLGRRTGWIVLFLALASWIYKIAAFKGAFG